MKAADWLAARQPTDGPVVFDDCRFPNESLCIQTAGGKVVHVETSLPVCQTRILGRDGACDPAMFEHESEKWHAVMPHDAVMPGTGDVAHLEQNIAAAALSLSVEELALLG